MSRRYPLPRPAARAGIDFGNGPVAATVVWVDKSHAGLSFAQALLEISLGLLDKDLAEAA